MTIESEVSSAFFLGPNTLGPYQCNFHIENDTEIQVVVTTAANVQTTLVLTTNYYVVRDIGPDGFNLYLNITYANDSTLYVGLNLPYTQRTDFRNEGEFSPETHEVALDKMTRLAQQLKALFTRALKLPVGFPFVSATLPAPSAGKLLGWSQDGASIVNTSAVAVGAGAIGTTEIVSGAVTASRLADGAVTSIKLNDAVFSGLVDAGTIQTTDYVVIADASNSFNKRKALVSGLPIGITTIGRHTIFEPAMSMRSRTASSGLIVGNTPGGVGQPDRTGLDFDQTTQEFAEFIIAMPKSWNKGTLIAKFHWQPMGGATSQGVVWQLSALAVGDTESTAQAFGTPQQIADTYASGTAATLFITAETPAITVANTPANGDLVFFQVARSPADAADTLAADARLLGVSLYYTTDAETDA